ncbi:tubulin-folding cofactor B-like protein [Dinothrombium tinctorium]|uniref:Tubulin-folding cofactor B-like protein n=1 Tax=Dinothrombium tinctorium TaxID=1965070 RepID=A0A3S4RK07_9ACAR|nr:tubulin-folding cofactor B-like protein [Dinothrombium tinctorium]RWS17129.1 tubulin-folding cofactor B-like protein [Dinothrombium tinctorium]
MNDSSYLSVKVTTENDADFFYEKRYPSNIAIGDLKAKLELVTGVLASEMKIDVYHGDEKLCTLLDDNRSLNSYLTADIVSDKDKDIHLLVYSPYGKNRRFEEEFGIEDRFKLTEEEYEKRVDSLLAFKMKRKLGRFAEVKNKIIEETVPNDVKVGQRCRVRVKGNPTRTGTVMYVGKTNFKPGIWVGVRYDEPLGKNDGSVDGVRYFECQPKYGGFVRLADIEIGDFMEQEMDELLEEL